MAKGQTTVPKPASQFNDIRSLAQNVHGLFSTIQRRISLVTSVVFLVTAYAGVPWGRRRSRR
jgi:hypothetical protein